MPAPEEVVDSHIHLFDVHNTPRLTAGLVKAFGWNERVLRFAAKRLFPRSTVEFFGENNYLIADYFESDLGFDSIQNRVSEYVHIQAGWKDKTPLDAAGETQWLETLVDPPTAIVGYADLSLADEVLPVLKAHKGASSQMRGIRHMLANHPSAGVMDFADDPDLAGRASFRRGYEHLAREQLSYDAWAYSHQLGLVADLAATEPDVPMVLCHGGTPVGFGGNFAGVGSTDAECSEITAQWRAGIASVAGQPNTMVKLSGFLMPVLGFGFELRDTPPGSAEIADKIGPLVRHCIDSFGPERCMFGSNFPVDKVSASYESMFDAMVQLTEQDGEQAQAQMFAGTVRKFYRI